MSSLDHRLTVLEGTRPNKGQSPAERLTLRELDAALAAIDRVLKDNETKRVAALKKRLTPAQFHAHEARLLAQQARDDLRVARIQIDPAWQVQGFDATKLSTDQMSALLTHTAAEMTANHSPKGDSKTC